MSVADQQALLPDTSAIRADLEYMTARWHELPEPAVFEIRAFKESASPQTARFAPDWIDDAVDWCESLNELGFNLYAVRNPIRATVSGSASDTDILAAIFLWADCDDDAATGNVRRFDGPKWSASIVTGQTPTTRVHTYWQLDEWCHDLTAWRKMQERIAAHFGSDRAVVNPSRIMRIAGTVAHPFERKRAKGYIRELATMRVFDAAERPMVSLAQMDRVFGAKPDKADKADWIDTGDHYRSAADYAEILRRARTDGEKHTGVRDLAASLAAQGVNKALAEAIVRDASPVWDDNVETLIRTAYEKFWKAKDAPAFDHAPAEGAPSWRMQQAGDFTRDFVSPEYLVDGVVQRGRLYTLTAPTGSGKTAVMLYAATSIASGSAFCEREIEPGAVLFLAGENPDDVRARVIGTCEHHNIDPAALDLHFIAGTFSIRADMERLAEEAGKLPNLALVVVDTFAAYFDGDDENSNAQALDFARVVRRLAELPSRPAVIMPAHPVKNATKRNLTPKGGSSLLNEVDGNLTLWNDAGMLTLHWQGKHRGPDFEALQMELERHESEKLKDRKGRLIPTILAKPLLEIRAIEIARETLSLEDKTLLNVSENPAQSVRDRAVAVGLVLKDGRAHKSKMARVLEGLQDQKLVYRFRSNWELTTQGEKAVEMIRRGDRFAEDLA